MFFKKRNYVRLSSRGRPEVKKDLWEKCSGCGKMLYKKKWEENLKVCIHCGLYGRMTAGERISMLADSGTFREQWPALQSTDPLGFTGAKAYKEKLEEDMEKTGMNEAFVAGECKLSGINCCLGVLDANFIMGSMGSVVGEKIARLCEYAIEKKMPVISVSGGGGGARMYEGMFSLMQMAKTSAVIGKMREEGVLYLSVLTDPTMGGVAASFAMLGDIIIAEPKALIGFAGPRVIEQTIRQKLPPGFQRSEFLYEHGLIDMVVERKDLKNRVGQILQVLHA